MIENNLWNSLFFIENSLSTPSKMKHVIPKLQVLHDNDNNQSFLVGPSFKVHVQKMDADHTYTKIYSFCLVWKNGSDA